MAKLAEQFVILKVSKAVRNGENTELEVLTDELLETLAEVVQSLVDDSEAGNGCIVDVERG